MMDPSTAQGAYGFTTWTQAVPGGLAVMPETQVGSTGEVPSGALAKLPFHWDNPLFWLLLAVLVWTGYIYGGFNLGVKKLTKGTFKVGR